MRNSRAPFIQIGDTREGGRGRSRHPATPYFMADFLLYGAYGYTGNLICRHAADHGLVPLLAGRSAAALAALAARTGYDYRVVDLANTAALLALVQSTDLQP